MRIDPLALAFFCAAISASAWAHFKEFPTYWNNRPVMFLLLRALSVLCLLGCLYSLSLNEVESRIQEIEKADCPCKKVYGVPYGVP
jgi:hypothetical protein